MKTAFICLSMLLAMLLALTALAAGGGEAQASSLATIVFYVA